MTATLVFLGLFSTFLAVVGASEANTCRCYPDQWEGVLDTVEKEFELESGQVFELKSKVFVHYDFANRRFATEDLTTGRRSLADSRLGVRFNIHGSRCRAVYTTEPMRPICFPAGATVVSSATIGLELAVNIWNFIEPTNATVTTTATRDSCIPIIEDVTVKDTGYMSLSSTLYTDVSLGIRNVSVFDMPENCVFVRIPFSIGGDGYNQRQKRHLSKNWKFSVN